MFVESLHEGEIVPVNSSGSVKLARLANSVIDQEFRFSACAAREAFEMLGQDEFFAHCAGANDSFQGDATIYHTVCTMLIEAGIDPSDQLITRPRILTVGPEDHNDPLAVLGHSAHRETWFGHSQSEITWWIALEDVNGRNGFQIFSGMFDKPVLNTSSGYICDEWSKLYSESPDKAARSYPTCIGKFDAEPSFSIHATSGVGFAFSSAHLHQTLKNATGKPRFALVLRTVGLSDLGLGRGAPNVDNRSTGTIIPRMFRLAPWV